MQFQPETLQKILSELKEHDASLVAVSKMKTAAAIKQVYDAGQRAFGENYVQELADKAGQLPEDIAWHFIGHLQSNKVKLIAPFISLIHGVDSFGLLKEIDRQAQKNNRVIDCLLQIHIAQEETKFGLTFTEAEQLIGHPDFHQLKNICVRGLMGMASLTGNRAQVKNEFHSLAGYFHQLQSRVYKTKKLNGKQPPLLSPLTDEIKASVEPAPQPANLKPEVLSMGMSSDYKIALLEGSTMVRIGSLIFGER
jgi:PLP dependent protein